MPVSALDTIVGPYCGYWSLPGFTVQSYVTGAQALVTGGTYAEVAPERAETHAEASAAVQAPDVPSRSAKGSAPRRKAGK